MLVSDFYVDKCRSCRNYIPTRDKKVGYCTLRFGYMDAKLKFPCHIKADKKPRRAKRTR